MRYRVKISHRFNNKLDKISTKSKPDAVRIIQNLYNMKGVLENLQEAAPHITSMYLSARVENTNYNIVYHAILSQKIIHVRKIV